MENTFRINGKKCTVTLDRTGLTWSLLDSSQGKFRVPAAEILSCWACPKGARKCCPPHDTQAKTWALNEGLTRDDGDSQLSTTRATSSLITEETSRPYGAIEGYNESSCHSNSVVHTDHQNSPPPSSTTPNVPSEKCDEGSRGKPKDRPTGLPFTRCIHSRKSNEAPALAVEICERVLPSRLQRSCSEGDGEVMVTTWKPRVLLLQHEALDTVRSWLEVLWEVVAGCPSRPRHLLVIVNPLSGCKTAEKVYNSRVAPLLHRAAIRITLKKTRHSGHAEELAQQAVVEGVVDGVVTVGGDGTAAEATAGLLKATALLLGVPIDDRNTALPKSSVALGVIPGGSTNAFVISCHGTEDITTSALQIIMGTRRDVHLGGKYEQDKLAQVILLMVHGGYNGGLIERTISLRHLGPKRNVIAAVQEFFAKRSYECEIRYLAKENSADLLQLDAPPCHALCGPCQAPSPAAAPQRTGQWVEIKGKYDIASISLVTCECRYAKYGVSPMCHVNNGYCDVILCPTMSKLRFFFKLLKFQTRKDNITDAALTAFRTSELHYRCLTPPKPPLNCDGELKYCSEFEFKMHRGCLPVYSRGREPLSTLDSSVLSNYFK